MPGRVGLANGESTGDGEPDEIGGSWTLSGRLRRKGGSGGADACMLLLRYTRGNSPVVVGELGMPRSSSTPAKVGLRSGCVGGGSAGRSESGRGGVRVGEVHAEAEGEVMFRAREREMGMLARATDSYERVVAPENADAGGLSFLRGGRVGATRSRGRSRAAELDEPEEDTTVASFVGLMLLVRRIPFPVET